MNSELQAMMARRRRMAEGGGGGSNAGGEEGGEGKSDADKQPQQQAPPPNRSVARGEGVGGATPAAPKAPSYASSTAGSSPKPARHPFVVPGMGSGGGPGGLDDLQAIFERRRRLSETGAASTASFEAGNSSTGSAGFEASPTYARPVINRSGQQASSSQLRVQIPSAPYASSSSGISPPVSSPPDAKTSPVKPELKKVAIDPALKAAMERRRNLLVEEEPADGGGGGVDDVDDGDAAPTRGPSEQHTARGQPQHRGKRTKDASAADPAGTRKHHPNVAIPPVPSIHSDDAAILQDDDEDVGAADSFDEFDQELKELETPRPMPPRLSATAQPAPASTRSTRSDDAVLLFSNYDGAAAAAAAATPRGGDLVEEEEEDDEDDDGDTDNNAAAADAAPSRRSGSSSRQSQQQPQVSKSASSASASTATATAASNHPSIGERRSRSKEGRELDAMVMMATKAGDDVVQEGGAPLFDEDALALAAAVPPALRSSVSEGAVGRRSIQGNPDRKQRRKGSSRDGSGSGGGSGSDSQQDEFASQAGPAKHGTQGAGQPPAQPDNTSLQALHRRHRRRSMAGGAGGGGSSRSSSDDDDYSRADSTVVSAVSGTTTDRPSGRRLGRRRHTETGSTTSSSSRPLNRRQSSVASLEIEEETEELEDAAESGRRTLQPPSHAPRPRDEPEEQQRRGSDPRLAGQQQAAAPSSSSKPRQRRSDYGKQGRSPSIRSMDSSDDAAQPPPKPRRDAPKQAASSQSRSAPDPDPTGSSRAAKQATAAFADSASDIGLDAWGDLGSAFTNDGAAATGSFDPSTAAFASFPAGAAVDKDFDAFGAFPAETKTAAKTPAVLSNAAFASFGADDGFGGADFGFGEFEAQESSTQRASALFDAPQKATWDTSPLTNAPVRRAEELHLVSRPLLTCSTLAGSPISNPLNGNIIFCSRDNGGATVHEVNPNRSNLQVASTAILTSELQRRIATKYNVSVSGISSVANLAAGVHLAHGQARLRVAAIVDLKVIESPQPLRIVAVWQWGYGTPIPISVQFTLTPPSGGDFTYDASMLQVADGLIFIGGHSPKGPCVFTCKPTVRETWSVNFLGGTGRITCIAVTPGEKREAPFLAVGLSDRSVSIWTYKGTIGVSASKTNESSVRWLLPLCQLNAATSLVAVEATSFPGSSSFDVKDAGCCTHLAWLPSQRTSSSALLLLACAFQNGVAVFHVGLPSLADVSKGEFRPFPEPSQSTTLAQAPVLSPFSLQRWQGRHETSSAAWHQLGPHANPCLAILLRSSDADGGSAVLFVTSLMLPLYKYGPLAKERTVSLDIVASRRIENTTDPFPTQLIQTSGLSDIVCICAQGLLSVSLSRTDGRVDHALATTGQPVSSDPPGLTSVGEPFFSDAVSDTDGVLHVYTVFQCERQRSESNQNLQEWGRPRRRHWLCRTLAGDTKATSIAEDSKEDRGFGGGDTAKGGSSSDVVCELFDDKLHGLLPSRIVRCKGASICAVLFTPVPGRKAMTTYGSSCDATAVAIVEFSSSNPVIRVIPGRDIAFWPREGSESQQGVVLSVDGSALSSITWSSSERKIVMGVSHRPIVGVDTDGEYIECRRVLSFSGASMICIGILGTRHKDGRWCFVTGDLASLSDVSCKSWSPLLPNVVEGTALWLDVNEEVLSVVGLEHDDGGYRNFALATSRRVIIVSAGMEVLASTPATVSAASLSPLGSFAVAFFSAGKLRYLSCLDGVLASGAMATIPVPQRGLSSLLLLMIRPDRFLYSTTHEGLRLVEHGQNPHGFLLPASLTKPALLLEPLVANAICVGGKTDASTPVLRIVIERFGRKLVSTTHGEDEGIGNIGAGITPRTFEILNRYGLQQANSWLLTGTARFDRSTNSRIIPSWLPLAPKVKGAVNSDAFLHVVSNGDQYLSDFIKAPETSVPPSLPRASGPIAYACRDYAVDAIRNGRAHDAIKSLDLAGGDDTERTILDLAMALSIDRSKNAVPLLKAISGIDASRVARTSNSSNPAASLAALAVCLKRGGGLRGTPCMAPNEVDQWLKPLAPSLQRGMRISRPRQTVFASDALQQSGETLRAPSDPIWTTPCNESKHVWNEGPRKEKNNLLLLDSIEEWLGRRRPVIVGKEGASAARDRGDKTLADILNKEDDDSFGGKSDLESELDGWVDGVGEGRSDEANLSAYFRMSEGEDEDSPWRTDGIEDLSPFQNRAKLVGEAASFSLQPTSSSVDEGEPGKVKALYDLVFEKASNGSASGLLLPAHRGGSLDVGAFHLPQKSTRHKCSIEFWFYLPSTGNGSPGIVLARRTMGPHADELSKACVPTDKETVLWELLLRPNGELEFTTCAGSSLKSTQNYAGPRPTKAKDDDDDSDEETERRDLATSGRWNHVCIVIAQQREVSTSCSVSIIMKGVEVASSSKISLMPRGLKIDDLDSDAELDRMLKKSVLVMGLNHGAGFRLTEIRVWACERTAEDTQSMLYEYLTCAEAKKKFKVKISNKKSSTNFKGSFGTKGGLAPLGLGGAAKAGGRGMLAPTKSGAMLAMSKGFSLAPQRAKVAPVSAIGATQGPPPPSRIDGPSQPLDLFPAMESTPAKADERHDSPASPAAMAEAAADFAAAFGGLGGDAAAPFPMPTSSTPPAGDFNNEGEVYTDVDQVEDEEVDEQDMPATLWDTAVPLSQQVRSSAAAALIRGPPATRHFGGNRGGLPDFSGMDRFGVGGIAICGSEKTIVWRDNEDPPALTYPIGASGAVVSDLMDDEGSEFLCCFLAKEKRMVVFELQSRTVVVELQMTTKLNFWRFLPPEAAENTLCFMLVTPVGGFHWMPLEESPRPHQVWKRGPELQGKKVVCYEEGGSNGLEGSDILSRVALVMVTKASGDGALEAWIVPVDGDSQAGQVSDDVMGACFCQPPYVEDGPFLPLLMTVHQLDEGIYVNVLSVTEPRKGSVKLGEIEVTRVIEETGYEDVNYDPPDLAMGSFPEAICCSLGNIVVIVIRRKGLIAAFELEEDDLSLIALEGVGHYVIDAVMRYSSEVGGAEIVMLLSDEDNPKDGRMVSFCFRSAV